VSERATGNSQRRVNGESRVDRTGGGGAGGRAVRPDSLPNSRPASSLTHTPSRCAQNKRLVVEIIGAVPFPFRQHPSFFGIPGSS
jgi:hypothetical protein